MKHRRRFWMMNGALAVVVAVLALLGVNAIFSKASAPAAVRTVTVGMGDVSSTVSASGNVAPAQSEDVNFSTSGTVTAVDVALGQQVKAGQVLATMDPGPAQAALTAAQDSLTAAQDNLALAQAGGESPPEQAEDAATISSADAEVAAAQSALTAAQEKLASDQASCSSTTAASSTVNTSNTSSSGCSAVAGDQQSGTQDQNSLTQAQNTVSQDQLSIAVKRYVNPATILQGQATVTQAQETVTEAQKTLSETTLTAPLAGTVTVLNGAVGQTVSGGGNSAASSSGSSGSSGTSGTGASSGAASSGSSGSSGSTASSGSSASSGSTSPFLTLSNMSNLVVVAGFSEADATKVAVGQTASVTLSALTGTSVPGKVTAVSPVSTVVSNVVTYNDTVTLTDPSSDVKSGMTADASVTVASANNVLEVPSSVIATTGRASTVTLDNNGKQSSVTVTTGLVGNTDIQITAGLSAGETVVEPSVTVGSSASTGSTSRSTGTGTLGGGASTFGGGGFGGGG
jgi:multidrug efflux pump subunit AcrA (membrane-fusion protein)